MPTDANPTPDTLHVRLTSPGDFFDDLEAVAARVDDGEAVTPDDEGPVLYVENLAALSRVFRETNLELLEAAAEHEPDSVRELARLVDRGPKEVLENVDELEDYGLLRLEDEGRAKRPVVWYGELDIDVRIPLRDPDDEAVLT